MRKRFSEVVVEMQPEVRRLSRSSRQRVPGMTPEDIEAEMLECLWRARLTYKKSCGVTFPAYWWACWMNRKRDLIKFWLRGKRDYRSEMLCSSTHLQDLEEELHAVFPIVMDVSVPEPPVGCSEQAKAVWILIASGFPLSALRKELGPRVVNAILLEWRSNPTMKGILI